MFRGFGIDWGFLYTCMFMQVRRALGVVTGRLASAGFVT